MTTTAATADTTTATAGGDVATLAQRLADDLHAALEVAAAPLGMAAIAALLRAADRAKAAAVEASMDMTHAGVLADEGLTAGSYLRVHARRTAAEERSLGYLVERLADMPTLRGWYRDGVVSDGVVREIAWATRNLTKTQRGWIDQTLAGDPARVIRLGGDGLVDAVQQLADHARPELQHARQQRAFDGRRVHAQERLDGTGGTLFADLDAEGFHTVLTALDTYQPNHHGDSNNDDRERGGDDTDTDTGTAKGDDSDSHHDREPRRGDDDDDGDSDRGDDRDGEDEGEYGARDRWRTARSRRRADALAAIARHRNADTCPANHPTHDCAPASHDDGGVAHGGVAGAVGWAPPPAAASLLILADIAALADPQHRDHATATLLAKTAGGPVRVTATAADRLLCDGTWRLIFTDGAEIIAVAPTQQKVPADLKAMVTARDLHCRFPSCQTPAPACDIHHLTPRHHGGATTLDNLAVICPQHHHAIHDGGWTATRHPDDTLTFTRRRTTITTLPATQRPFTPTTPPPAGRPPRRRARGTPPSPHTTPASGRPTRPPPAAADERQPEPLPF